MEKLYYGIDMPVINIKLLISSFKNYCSVYLNVQFLEFYHFARLSNHPVYNIYICIYMRIIHS